MHARAERRVDRHAPVAELVAEPFDDDGAIVRQRARGLPLLLEVGEQVVGGPVIESGVGEPLAQARRVGARPQELPEGATEFDRATDRIAVPERQPRDLAGCGGDDDAIGSDLLDPPGARPECEDVAHARLVDHLLVEFAHTAVGAHEHDRIQAAIGDGAAAHDREALRARTRMHDVVVAVPDDARPQLGEVVAWVLARQHVEHGVEHARWQVGVRRCPGHVGIEVVDGPLVHGGYGDDLLREHVERIARDRQGLDGTRLHALDDDGTLQ